MLYAGPALFASAGFLAGASAADDMRSERAAPRGRAHPWRLPGAKAAVAATALCDGRADVKPVWRVWFRRSWGLVGMPGVGSAFGT